jgi:tRNA dimethylallyltransferase
MNQKVLVVVVGPTAVGKTVLAVNLAKHFNCDVLSSDSRQFYKEMAIGTAKPSLEEMDGVKHHFIDSLNITEEYTVADFEVEALKKLEILFKENNIQVVAGGSGLFVRTLLHGIDYFPDVDPQIRIDLAIDLEEKGIENLQERVKELDPEYYKEVDQENPQRLLRALEICIGTGKTFSSFRIKKDNKRDFKVLQIGLTTERELLYNRINQRVDLMIENGLIEEAQALHAQRGLVSLKTVGFTELFDYFEGTHSLERAIELIKRNSRRYAKRQLTWFKKDESVKWFEPNNQNHIISHLQQEIKNLS